jgi:hypothetical protein
VSDLLSESRFDEAIQGASAHHRAALYKHFFVLQHQLKGLEAELATREAVPVVVVAPPEPPTEPTVDPSEAIDRAITDTRRTVREDIVAWLRATHTADTVRAAYARKLAGLIEDGADEAQSAASAPPEEHAA